MMATPPELGGGEVRTSSAGRQFDSGHGGLAMIWLVVARSSAEMMPPLFLHVRDEQCGRSLRGKNRSAVCSDTWEWRRAPAGEKWSPTL